jgi:atypical dual specificity phosphatase
MFRRFYAALVYYPTLAWNIFQGRISHRWQWWTVLEPHLILGAVPFRSDVPKLAALGVKGVVNTCAEFPGHEDLYQPLGIEQFWMPTVDFSPPSLADVQAAVAFMQHKVSAGETVYVHCKAGRARSATVVVCYLIARYGWTPERAQSWIRQRRPQILRSVAQRQVVRDFAAQCQERAAAQPPDGHAAAEPAGP